MEGIYEPQDATEWVKRFVKQTPVGALLRSRPFHLYNIGAPKTGTSSIGRLFAVNYRSRHEPWAKELIHLLRAAEAGTLNRWQVADRLKKRDRLLHLACESSHIAAHFCGVLARTFPNAKFLLAVRKPRAWLDSMINQCINISPPQYYRTLRDLYFGPRPDRYAPGEAVLENHRLYSVDGFLRYWARHNKQVLTALPAERLLVIRTNEISERIDRIATFVGVPPETLDASKSHSHKAPKKYGIVDRLDQNFLEDKIAEHCYETLDMIEQTTAVSLI